MPKPYYIRISSSKGGVGKTTVAINLAAALASMGSRVALVEGNVEDPSLALELGMSTRMDGLSRLLNGGKVSECVTRYEKSGIDVLLKSPYTKLPDVGLRHIVSIMKVGASMGSSGYDFVIIDTQPGMMDRWAYTYTNEAILVATEDMPAMTSLLKLANELDRKRVKHSLLLNGVANKSYNISRGQIREMYHGRILGALPQDGAVVASALKHTPVVTADRGCAFSKEMMRIAKAVQSRAETGKGGGGERERASIWSTLMGKRKG
jgi:MinD-like ATPase involved in chromosome partitioning or flagellar assembly